MPPATTPSSFPTPTLLTPDFLRRLDRLDVLSRKVLQGKLRGERRSKQRGRSVEFADYRNYVHGDDPRFIDWNLYARLNRLFIRLFMEEQDLSVSLLIDVSRSMAHQPTGQTASPSSSSAAVSKLDYARRIAAALGYIGLVHNNRVHLYAFRQMLHEALTNLRGRRPVPRMLDFLANLRDEPGPGDLARVTRRYALAHRGKGVVVLITDLLDKGDIDQALKVLLGDRYDVFVLHVLSPQELTPEATGAAGDLRLRDVEDEQMTEVSITPALLKQYHSRLDDWRESVRKTCLRRGATYIGCDTSQPFDELVLRLLREKGLVG